MYSPQVLDHFEHPRNAGELADASATVRLENPACGDVLEFAIRIADGTVAEARFRARGCVATMACASKLTELLVGSSLSQAAEIRRETLVESLGGLPNGSTHASHLAMDALDAALRKFSATR